MCVVVSAGMGVTSRTDPPDVAWRRVAGPARSPQEGFSVKEALERGSYV